MSTSKRRGWRNGCPWQLACAVAVIAGPAWAAGEPPGRYTMNPVEGGVIRLDRETGAMAFCSGTDGNWSCKDMPVSEPAPGPSAVAPRAGEPPAVDAVPPPPGDLPVPTERDVDKLFDYVEGMVKKFKERIDRLEREANKEPDVPL